MGDLWRDPVIIELGEIPRRKARGSHFPCGARMAIWTRAA